MCKKWGLMAALACGVVTLGGLEAAEQPTNKMQTAQADSQSFTGQIKGNRVRMRLHADRDSAIIDELERGQLVAVVGTEEEFYEILPPKGTRAYVFRTYVLDNRIEGNKVNVRLQPSLDAPVIAQLSDGDYVQGEVSLLNNKWIEIPPPASTRFYVAKEFIERAGNSDHLSKVEKRQEEATHLVNSAYASAQAEFHKPFQEMHIEPMMAQLQLVLDDYNDVPQEVTRANYYLTILKDNYLQKKIHHLEAKAAAASDCFQNHCEEFGQRVKAHQNVLDALEQGLSVDYISEEEENEILAIPESPREEYAAEQHQPHPSNEPQRALGENSIWVARETMAYEAWRAKHPNHSLAEFYQDQAKYAEHKRGIIQPYTRKVAKKPGNYLLIDPHTSQPIAFLYSTQMDLQSYVGQVHNLTLSQRPDNNFAFPAFFVLSVE